VPLDTGLNYQLLEWGADRTDQEHTVILIHGFLDSSWGWQALVNAGLGERFHVVAPDMRGHGDSDRVGAGGYYHFVDYVADLHSVVQRFARRRLSLVGHSMGGTIASLYAGCFPDRTERLVLLEGAGPPESSETLPERMVRWISEWPRARERGSRQHADLAAAIAQLRRYDPLLSPELATNLAIHGTTPAAGGGVQFKHDPMHLSRGPHPFSVAAAQQFWERVRCPVLWVEGECSSFRHSPAEQARRLACFRATTVRSETIAGASHMMQRHQPVALSAMLSDFLQTPA
jgi:pimeloyl-ACP methyl ester carboxylesterase